VGSSARLQHSVGFLLQFAPLYVISSESASLTSGVVTTAPPKPSAQTQILLTYMEERVRSDDAHWDSVMDSLDVLFAKVGAVEHR